MGSVINSSRFYILMVVVQCAYGGSNILVKLAIERGLTNFVFIMYRHLIALVIFVPFAYVLERKHIRSLSFCVLMKIFFLATLGTVVHQSLYYTGLDYTSPTVASAISNVVPALTFLMAILFKMEKMSLKNWKGRAKVLGTIICLGGALIFTLWKGYLLKGLVKRPLIDIQYHSENHTSRGVHHIGDWIRGILLILAGLAAYCAWLILQAMVYEVFPALLSTNTIICFFATIQSSILALIFERKSTTWKLSWNLQLWAIIYSGIVISGLVYYSQMLCISEKGPVFAAMFSPLLLVIVAIFSALVFAEQFHLGSIVGALLIVVGLYCVLWGKSKSTRVCSEKGNLAEEKC